jgi:hypothetical protein
MKIKYLFIVIIFGSLFSSCEDKTIKKTDDLNGVSPSKQYSDMFNNKVKRHKLEEKVFSKGDTLAYRELFDIYFISGNKNDFLKIAMIMANDYNFPEAYIHVYTLLNSEKINAVNQKSNKLANFYLLKAYELDKESGYEVDIEERFGNKPVPKSKDYWLEINK